jgi:hypothetical protein
MTPYNTSPKIEKFGYLPGALLALKHDPGVFVQGTRLVELIHCPNPEVAELDYGRLRERLDCNQIWRGFAKPTLDAPPAFYAQFLRRKDWPGVKKLAGFTDVPLLRPDGTVLDEGGYDEDSAFHYEPAGDFNIPAEPTHDDAIRALDLLTRRFRRLPFESEAHRSAFFAALLTPFARAAFKGPTPMFQFDAPTDCMPMALGNYVSQLVQGDDMLLMEKPASERSFRSQLARTQLRAEHMVLVTGADTWRSANALRTALFSLKWADGSVRKTDPRPITWFAATANGALTQSIAKLMLPIRLDATEDLATRESWEPPPEFKESLARDRTRLVSAALTILRAYVVAGRPAQDLETWSDFKAWTKLVPSALVWAGAANPLDARQSAFDAVNDDTPELDPLFEILHTLQGDRPGLTSQQIIDHAKEDDDLRSVLQNLLSNRWESSRTVGEFLRKYVGLRLEHLRLEKAGKNRLKAVLWRIRRLAESAESLHAADEELYAAELFAPIESSTTPIVAGGAKESEGSDATQSLVESNEQSKQSESAEAAQSLNELNADAKPDESPAPAAAEVSDPSEATSDEERSAPTSTTEELPAQPQTFTHPTAEIATPANDDRAPAAESAESLHAALPPPKRKLSAHQKWLWRQEPDHPVWNRNHGFHWRFSHHVRYIDITYGKPPCPYTAEELAR